MHSIDIFVQNYFSLARTPFATEFLYILTSLFNVSLYSALLTLFTTYLIYLVRNIRYAVLFLSSLAAGVIAVYFLKMFFNVARPTDFVFVAHGQSFPSYHATIASIFFIMLMYIFDDYFSSFFRIIFNTLSILAIFAIAFSRIYLGVHWVSDVVFGVLLGALVSYISIRLFRSFESRL